MPQNESKFNTVSQEGAIVNTKNLLPDFAKMHESLFQVKCGFCALAMQVVSH